MVSMPVGIQNVCECVVLFSQDVEIRGCVRYINCGGLFSDRGVQNKAVIVSQTRELVDDQRCRGGGGRLKC